MKSQRLLLAVLISPLFAHVSNAGTVTGTIDRLYVRDSDGLTYVIINAVATGQPACATNAYWMIKDETSESGKKQFSMLLAAKLAGATVQIHGANTCTRWADGEDINNLEIL